MRDRRRPTTMRPRWAADTWSHRRRSRRLGQRDHACMRTRRACGGRSASRRTRGRRRTILQRSAGQASLLVLALAESSMSRIDEAMRRAAEQSGRSPRLRPTTESPIAADDRSPTSLDETFPIEMRRAAQAPCRDAGGRTGVSAPSSRHRLRAPRPQPSRHAGRRNLDAATELPIAVRADRRALRRTRSSSMPEHVGRRRASSTAGWPPALHHAQAASGLKVVMIASAVPAKARR